MRRPFGERCCRKRNGILKEEYLDTQQIKTVKEAVTYLHEAIKLYNSERPHMSISNYTPDKVHYAKEPVQVKRIWKNYYGKKKEVVMT